MRHLARFLAILLTAGMVPEVLRSEVVRTFVSVNGSDSAICSRTSPCRTFGAALAAVSPGGEVLALTSGGYSPVTITKSVTIAAPSAVHAAIAPSSGTAITINAGATDKIVLRGLHINGPATQRGIDFGAGLSLHVERFRINNCGIGIQLIRSASSNEARLYVSDTEIQNGNFGIYINLNGDVANVLLERVRIEHNLNSAVTLFQNVNVTARHCVTAGNFAGFSLTAGTGGSIHLDRTAITGNTRGIQIGSSSTVNRNVVRLNQCLISSNTRGILFFANAIVETMGNNVIRGNEINLSGGTLTDLPNL